MALKSCTVPCEDVDGHEHVLEVTAQSLYEAVAQALAAFRGNGWVGDIGKGTQSLFACSNPQSSTASELQSSSSG